jgi:HNH endonuclease
VKGLTLSAVVQHQNARKVLRIIQAADRDGRPLNYQTLAAEIGHDPAKHARAMAQVCDLLDAAAAQAGIPLLALVKVLNSDAVINPMAWTKNTPPGVRDAIIKRSLAHKFSSADFQAIEQGLAALDGLGNRTAWLKVRREISEEQLYLGLTQPAPRQFDDALDDIGSDVAVSVPVTGTRFRRDPQVRDAVVLRSGGRCEYCKKLGFLKDDGEPYVETHHIIALAEEGADRISNVIALCADHHREAHFAAMRSDLEQKFVLIVKGKAGP